MVEEYLTQREQPRRRFLWNKLKCFSQTSLPMKIGVIAMQGTKTFQTHLRKRSHCHRHHQHSLNFKRHCTQGATGQRQAQMAFQTQYGSVAHGSMLRSLTSYSEFGSHARCLRPGSARQFDFSTNQDQRTTQPNFRPITLSNCEGKIFFALLGKAMLENMLKNSFFDQRLQKGFLPGVAGCLGHSALLADAIQMLDPISAPSVCHG